MTVKELKEITKVNVPIKGIFVISKCELKPFAAKGGYFMQCQLTDLTGSIKGIVWDGAEAIKLWIKNKMVVETAGDITRYNDMPQVIVKTLKQKTDYNPADFLPSLPPNKILTAVCSLNEYGNSIKDTICLKLWKAIIPVPRSDGYDYPSSISEKFIQCPGGVGEVHHNYLGGLLEHSYGMIKAAITLSEYSGLDKDILLTGCLLHDIGKIDSYAWDVVLEMTDHGRLLHHTTIGYEILMGLIEDHEIFYGPISANKTLLKLAHIIIAHHEDEGLRKPMFPEAQAVSALDSMDAAVQHAMMFSNKSENQEQDSNWTTFCRLTERQYYMPKKVQEAIQEPEKKKPKVEMESMF